MASNFSDVMFVVSRLKMKHFLLYCLKYYSIKDDPVLVEKKKVSEFQENIKNPEFQADTERTTVVTQML